MRRRVLTAVAVIGIAWTVWAAVQTNSVTVTCGRASHQYRLDEAAEFDVTSDVTGLPVRVSFLRGYLPIRSFDTTTPVRVSHRLGEPGFVVCKAQALDSKGPFGPDARAGAGFEPSRIRTALPPPKDYDAFWEGAFAEQAAIAPDFTVRPLSNDVQLVSCRTVQGMRMYGFLYIPKGRGPFPLQVNVGGGDSVRCVEAEVGKARDGRFANRAFLDIHLPPWEPSVWSRKEASEAHSRWKKENNTTSLYRWNGEKPPRERWYYRCILGSCRLVEYATQRPGVDPGRVYYIGASTGGGYGVFLAAFSPHIRAAICEVPNYGNAGGPSVGRPSGEDDRGEHWQTSLYYDSAYCAPRITCPVFMSCGYLDNYCTPETVYCIYNELKCRKVMYDKVENGHGDRPVGYDAARDAWLEETLGLQAKEGGWPGFSRGMGIGGWLTNYKRFNVLPVEKRLTLTNGDFAHFDTYITEGDVERIKRWGFDHIRLGFDQIVLEEKPGVWRERTFRRIDDFIGWCGKHKVNVVLNLHKAIGNYCDIPEKVQLLDDAGLQERFIALWLEIERRYHGFSGLAFEILNEVRDVNPEKWNALADRTIRAIREKNPDRWVVVGSTCWNAVGHLKQLKVWDDPKVVYTFHMYNPFMFTHQRGVLQAGPLYENVDVPYPGKAEVERCLAPAAEWKKVHPDKILWNGEFGTIRHIPLIARADYMRDVIGFCRREGIPYCVWNYLSTPNDGNRFSLVDDDTRDFLSDELLRACLGLGDKAADGELKYVTFNIWGPYFGNPVCERDLKIAAFLEREGADLIGFQECEKEFWSSRLFTRLGKTGYGWIADGKDLTRDLNPLLYRKSRLELLESGVERFRKEDNPQGTKGFSWGVFRDRATGRKFFAYSTHFWWRTEKGEAYRKNEAMRVGNVRELLAKCDEVSKRHGELAIVGGGDLNSTLILRNASLGEFGTLGLKDAQFTVKGASPWSSHHGNPKRDGLGNLRPFFQPGSDNPSNSLDHVHYRGVEPLTLRVDRTQDVLECSDHSPVIFTFKLN